MRIERRGVHGAHETDGVAGQVEREEPLDRRARREHLAEAHDELLALAGFRHAPRELEELLGAHRREVREAREAR
jgi:hypothetical protein